MKLYDIGKMSLLKSAQFGLSASLSTISMKSSLIEKLQVWPVTEVIECLKESRLSPDPYKEQDKTHLAELSLSKERSSLHRGHLCLGHGTELLTSLLWSSLDLTMELSINTFKIFLGIYGKWHQGFYWHKWWMKLSVYSTFISKLNKTKYFCASNAMQNSNNSH